MKDNKSFTPTTLLASPTGRLLTGLALATSLWSCTAAQPQPYEARDNIGIIPSDLIIGKWQSTPLNAPSDAPSSMTIIEYRSDGMLRGSIQTPPNKTTGAPALRLDLTGNWQADGEWLRHTDIVFNAVGDSAYARQYNAVLNSSGQEFGNVTNVLELDEHRMITISKDGRATLYVRQ